MKHYLVRTPYGPLPVEVYSYSVDAGVLFLSTADGMIVIRDWGMMVEITEENYRHYADAVDNAIHEQYLRQAQAGGQA